MFTNLIESDSHRKEFKRRSSFFLATVAGYALIISAAGIVGIFAYDARVDAQTSSLEFLEWVPPVKPVEDREPPREPRMIRRPRSSNAQVDPNVTVSERTKAVAQVNDPTRVPETVGIKASDVPPVTGPVVLSTRNVDPPGLPSGNQSGCETCPGTGPVVPADNAPPPLVVPIKPPPQTVTTRVLASKAIDLPKPAYPAIAKQIRAQGPVNVQILIDESGKVISAHAVSGNATLIRAAEEAARRARFTPTMLGNQPVKVQGVITYNFVLQ